MVPGAVPEAFEILVQQNFETYIQDPVWLAKARRGDYFVDIITGVGNATMSVEESWIDRAVEDEVLGIRCKVIGPEELIASKLFVTRRERFDGADIAHLVEPAAGISIGIACRSSQTRIGRCSTGRLCSLHMFILPTSR